MSEVCLRLKGCVSWGGKKLYCIEGVELPCRGVVALIGENGSGKTTLLKTLAGLIDAVDGEAWTAKPLVYMPEEHFSPPPAKVREWLWLNGVRLEEALEAGLPQNLVSARIGRLSHGWRRFVELLSVVLSEARVYMLDEPFTGMDLGKLVDAWRLVCKAGSRGLVLLTGHDVSVFEELAGTLMIIRDGKVEIHGSS